MSEEHCNSFDWQRDARVRCVHFVRKECRDVGQLSQGSRKRRGQLVASKAQCDSQHISLCTGLPLLTVQFECPLPIELGQNAMGPYPSANTGVHFLPTLYIYLTGRYFFFLPPVSAGTCAFLPIFRLTFLCGHRFCASLRRTVADKLAETRGNRPAFTSTWFCSHSLCIPSLYRMRMNFVVLRRRPARRKSFNFFSVHLPHTCN
jgi:hypothetical protein